MELTGVGQLRYTVEGEGTSTLTTTETGKELLLIRDVRCSMDKIDLSLDVEP